MTNLTCSIEECDKAATSRGFCRNHYAIWYRANADTVTRKRSKSLEDRFWSKVDKSGDCWIWTAGAYKAGYGSFSIGQSSSDYAHRVSYEMAYGSIPDDLMVDHYCRNRLCVNPKHLRLATPKQNTENVTVRHDNKSGYRGVCWDKQTQKWRGLVKHNGKHYTVGRFADKDECAEAIRQKRVELYTFNHSDRT